MKADRFSAILLILLGAMFSTAMHKALTRSAGASGQMAAGPSTGFSYQGTLAVDGAPATGIYDFQFSLWNADAGGIQVGTTVSYQDVTVSNGRFSVLLDFGDVFDGSDRYLEIAVRPGHSNGAYTTLGPRQALTATPYALYAGHVPWSGLKGVPEGFADGEDNNTTYLPGDGLNLGDDGVFTVQFAGNGSASTAARSDHLHDEQYYTETELQSAGGASVHWHNLSDVPEGFADGVDSDTTYTPGAGLALNGAQFDVVGVPRPFFSDQSVDHSGNDVGMHSATIIGADGLPLISYYDATAADLKVAHCEDLTCTNATITTVDEDGAVGQYTSITIGRHGYGLISYYDESNTNLKLAICNDIACTSARTTIVDNEGNVGKYTSITTTPAGYAFISYYDALGGNLKTARCEDIDCDVAEIDTVDSAANVVGQYASVTRTALGDALISYYDATDKNLKVAHCEAMSCHVATIRIVDNNNEVNGQAEDAGRFSTITTGSDGYALIAYSKAFQSPTSPAELRVAHCTTDDCATFEITTIVDGDADLQNSSLTVGPDGLALVAYALTSDDGVHLVRCRDVACNSQTTTGNVTAAPALDLSLTIGSDGLPVLSYRHGTSHDLYVVHCSDIFCQPYLRRR